MLGANLLFSRSRGRCYAIQDKCVHHPVRLSAKPGGPECYAAGTVTCWYHGFTYDTATGGLVAVLSQPDCPLIGREAVATYPVREQQGLIFVWIGDDQPGPLEDDCPPDFFQDDYTLVGLRRSVGSNWRIAAENGLDPTHVYLHVGCGFATELGIRFPLGVEWGANKNMQVVNDGGRWGLVDDFSNVTAVFEAAIGEQIVRAPGDKSSTSGTLSTWLPGVLEIKTTLPDQNIRIFEWYVPIDDTRHDYVQVLVRPCRDDAEAQKFRDSYESKWKELFHLAGFGDEDVYAREAMQEAYADESAWRDERLMKPDRALLAWRRLVAERARGYQPPPTSVAPPNSFD